MTAVPESPNGNVLIYNFKLEDDPREILETVRFYGIKVIQCLYTSSAYMDETTVNANKEGLKKLKSTIGKEAYIEKKEMPLFSKFTDVVTKIDSIIDRTSREDFCVYIDVTNTTAEVTTVFNLLAMKNEKTYTFYRKKEQDGTIKHSKLPRFDIKMPDEKTMVRLKLMESIPIDERTGMKVIETLVKYDLWYDYGCKGTRKNPYNKTSFVLRKILNDEIKNNGKNNKTKTFAKEILKIEKTETTRFHKMMIIKWEDQKLIEDNGLTGKLKRYCISKKAKQYLEFFYGDERTDNFLRLKEYQVAKKIGSPTKIKVGKDNLIISTPDPYGWYIDHVKGIIKDDGSCEIIEPEREETIKDYTREDIMRLNAKRREELNDE